MHISLALWSVGQTIESLDRFLPVFHPRPDFAARIRKQFFDGGKRFPDGGNLFSGAGKSFSGVGRKFPGAGNWFSVAGKSFWGVGKLFPDAGISFSDAGKSFPGTRKVAECIVFGLNGVRKAVSDALCPFRQLLRAAMKPITWDGGWHWDDPNLRWGDPSYVLEPGDPGYVPPPGQSQPTPPNRKKKTMKSEFILGNAVLFAGQLNKFRLNIGTYKPILELTDEEIAIQAADALYFTYIVTCADIMSSASGQHTS